MAKIDITDIKTIQEILNQAKKDKTAAADLLKSFSSDMLREAGLYLDDEKDAKDAVRRALNDAYKNIGKAEADNIAQWLNTYVQDEAISAIIPLEKAQPAVYTDEDEIPDPSAVLPSDQTRIKNKLLSVLKKLTPSERIVCVLKYRDQYSIQEIADLCNASEEDIKNILTQVKGKLHDSNIDLGVLFAMVNQLYPYYENKNEDDDNEISLPLVPKSKEEMTEEERFNTAVQELRDFFDSKAIPAAHISDRDIDDSEDPYSEDIDKTFEMKAIKNIANGVDDTASSAKMIIAAAMSADPDEKVSEKEYNPRMYWIKRIFLLLVMVVLGVLIGVLISMIRSNTRFKPSPAVTPTPEIQETIEVDDQTIEETEIPEETAEPTEEPVDDGTIGTITIQVTDLTIRTGPGVYYEQAGMTELNQSFTAYETAEADGYTWYRVGDDQWIADLQGQFVTFTPKS